MGAGRRGKRRKERDRGRGESEDGAEPCAQENLQLAKNLIAGVR